MKTYWENEGEANGQGDFVAAIDMEDGSRPQRFIGKSQKEVADALMVAQANATDKIRKQERELRTIKQPQQARPVSEAQARPLTADERFRVAQDMSDPAKAPEAIAAVVEAQLGKPLATVRQRLSQQEENERNEKARQAALAFAHDTEDFWAGPEGHNTRLVINYVAMHNWEPTDQNSYAAAWEAVKTAGLAVAKPTEEAVPATREEPPANGSRPDSAPAHGPTTRPRGVSASTGIRSTDVSAAPGGLRTARKYTRAQIEAMSLTEYDSKINTEPGFVREIEEIFGQPAR